MDNNAMYTIRGEYNRGRVKRTERRFKYLANMGINFEPAICYLQQA